MSRYQTISVPENVKNALEDEKGEKEWGDFLIDILNEARDARRMRAAQRLRELLTDEDLEKMREASREFKESFELR
jgi:predicted CopG family antitoxin